MVRILARIEHGYSACGGRCASGWYGGVLAIEDGDAPFLAVPEVASFEERADHARQWAKAVVDVPRRIVLVRSGGNQLTRRILTEAGYVEGPVCPREWTEGPVLAWIERRDDRWHLMIHHDDATRVVLSSDHAIRFVQLAVTDQGLLLAIERDAGPFRTMVQVVDERGSVQHSVPGKAPLLGAAGGGYVLATEQSSPNAVRMLLQHMAGSAVTAACELTAGDYLFNGDIAWSEKERTLVMAAESSPCFGDSNQIGAYRTIHTWQWDLVSEPTALGILPVEPRSFLSFQAPENIPPIRPRVLIEANGLAVLFKQHRFFGMKTFGWDLFRCRREDKAWGEPERLNTALTGSDSTFGLIPQNGSYTGLFPAHDNKGGPSRSFNHRVEIASFPADHRLERVEIPDNRKGEHRVPVSYKDISPEPPAFPSPYEGRQLIWGDLHIHSLYSQCVAAVDGTPEENIRYVREVLGCRVFAITEHTHWMAGPMKTWVYDRIEAAAGKDNVFLYACEPGVRDMQDANWYTRDRRTWETLNCVILSHRQQYHDILRQVREDLPPDSLIVMRHFHGPATPEAQIPSHFAPEFEVAMEAMQGRCNAMIEAREGATEFPNQFLNAGCRIGLVGGTDHFRICPNHFCLTGFWVTEVTPDGVWEALRSRHTIAMSDSRVAMATMCKGTPMGGEITLGKGEDFRVSVRVSCGRPIRRATLMRDGKLLPWTEVGTTSTTLDLVDPCPSSGMHWYVPTVEVETAYAKDHFGICHSSPYFVNMTG